MDIIVLVLVEAIMVVVGRIVQLMLSVPVPEVRHLYPVITVAMQSMLLLHRITFFIQDNRTIIPVSISKIRS